MQKHATKEVSPLELMEQSFHALRLAPPRVILSYYVGSLPFILGFLYFLTDMRHNALAHQRVGEAALVMALLYAWMKTFQAIFASGMRASVTGSAAAPLTPRQWLALMSTQAYIHATSLFVFPIAVLITIPAGYVYAFYQSVSVTASTDEFSLNAATKAAKKHCLLWPKQNHGFLGLGFLLSGVVAFNIMVLLMGLPYLGKVILGIDTTFSDNIFRMFNTTFFLSVWAATYLCVNPVMKTGYVLRCFYGESLTTGEDMRTEFREAVRISKSAAVLIPALLFLAPMGAHAQRLEANGADAAELKRAIAETINDSRYTWRMPREAPEEETKSLFEEFITGTMRSLGKAVQKVIDYIAKAAEMGRRLIDKLTGRDSDSSRDRSGESFFSQVTSIQFLTLLLLCFIVATLALLIYRMYRSRRKMRVEAAPEVAPIVPDLTKEDVTADQLPEDGWLALARELAEKGELRLALRALYLAGLSSLATSGLITIAKYKSNLDYQAELRRRAHAFPDVLDAFSQNVNVFDGAWYGDHPVTHQGYDSFMANLMRIRGNQRA